MAAKAPVKRVKARWVGPAGRALIDGTKLVPGETVAQITAYELENSKHWEPAGGAKKADKDGES